MTIERPREAETNPKEKPVLTPHQKEILILIAEGKTYKEVALFLRLSRSTIGNILARRKDYNQWNWGGVYEKLGACSETSAIVETLRRGIIQLEEIKIQRVVDEGASDEPMSLTERQIEILKLAARGETNFQIGLHLVLSEQTVKNHFSQLKTHDHSPGIFERLQIPSCRTAAVVRALQLGLFSLEDIFPT